MLTDAWRPMRPHPVQSRLWRSKTRFKSVYAGRGSGKTTLARMYTVRCLPLKKPWPDPMYFYALPTHDQAGRVAWPALKALVPKHWLACEPSESRRVITTVFGSTLHVVGLDKPARIEGVQWDFGVVDESSDQRPKVFDLNLRPALSHRNAGCWRIGVPKRTGPGAREFREFCELGESGTDPEVETFSWPSSDIMTPEEIASARRQLDEKDFNEQYCASWETVGGLVFYAFDGAASVDSGLALRSELPLLVGSDFNVDPMAWVVAQVQGDTLVVVDELWMRNTNTVEALDRLHQKFGSWPGGGVRFFGDAAGKARHTSASMSDYLHIKNDARFAGSRVFYPNANPPRHDRFAACNAMFKSASGERRLKVHPRCVHLIEDLEARAYEEGTSEPDDHDDVGHITDALGYLIHALFPLRPNFKGAEPAVYAGG